MEQNENQDPPKEGKPEIQPAEDDQNSTKSCSVDMVTLNEDIGKIKVSSDSDACVKQETKDHETRPTRNSYNLKVIRDAYSNQEIGGYPFGSNPVRSVNSELQLPKVSLDSVITPSDFKTVKDAPVHHGVCEKQESEFWKGFVQQFPGSKCDKSIYNSSVLLDQDTYEEAVKENVREAGTLQDMEDEIRQADYNFEYYEEDDTPLDPQHPWPCLCDQERCAGKLAPRYKKDKRTWLWKSEEQRFQAYRTLKRH